MILQLFFCYYWAEYIETKKGLYQAKMGSKQGQKLDDTRTKLLQD